MRNGSPVGHPEAGSRWEGDVDAEGVRAWKERAIKRLGFGTIPYLIACGDVEPIDWPAEELCWWCRKPSYFADISSGVRLPICSAEHGFNAVALQDID